MIYYLKKKKQWQDIISRLVRRFTLGTNMPEKVSANKENRFSLCAGFRHNKNDKIAFGQKIHTTCRSHKIKITYVVTIQVLRYVVFFLIIINIY